LMQNDHVPAWTRQKPIILVQVPACLNDFAVREFNADK
jgi:hypothetical protein